MEKRLNKLDEELKTKGQVREERSGFRRPHNVTAPSACVPQSTLIHSVVSEGNQLISGFARFYAPKNGCEKLNKRTSERSKVTILQ